MTRTAAPVMALALVALSALPAAAQYYKPRDGYYDRGPRYVVAESQFGNGSVSGPVRHGRNGLEVRLPRGTWIECVRSCSDTLRRATVDFWETHGHNAPGSARGYLRWEFGF